MSERFDLVDCQKMVRELRSREKLYEVWDWVCRLYDTRHISRHDLNEMRPIIWGQFKKLDALEKMLSQPETVQNAA